MLMHPTLWCNDLFMSVSACDELTVCLSGDTDIALSCHRPL